MDFEHIDENTIWTTHEGRRIRFKDLEDTHIANILHYRKCCNGLFSFSKDEVTQYLKRLAKKRGLTKEFLEKAPYPFKDTRNRWRIWTLKNGFHTLQD